MADWEMMFRGVQQVTRSAKSVDEGIGQIITYARNHKGEYGELGYWQRLDRLETDYPVYEVTEWAQEGLTALPNADGWDFLLLDLGDAPDVFHLYRFTYYSDAEKCLQWIGHDGSFNENNFRRLLSANSVIEVGMLDECFDADPSQNSLDKVGSDLETLAHHSVAELNSDVFSWNKNGSIDWHGSSGELAWLTFGSLALIEPLRDPDFCGRILGGRRRLYLLSGFESIFFHLATVTPDGLTFNA